MANEQIMSRLPRLKIISISEIPFVYHCTIPAQALSICLFEPFYRRIITENVIDSKLLYHSSKTNTESIYVVFIK